MHAVPAAQDVDSTIAVMVDGQKLERGKRTQLKPGAVLTCGDDVCFQVMLPENWGAREPGSVLPACCPHARCMGAHTGSI